MENSDNSPAWLGVLAFIAILAVPFIAAMVRVEGYKACVAANSRDFCRAQAAR